MHGGAAKRGRADASGSDASAAEDIVVLGVKRTRREDAAESANAAAAGPRAEPCRAAQADDAIEVPSSDDDRRAQVYARRRDESAEGHDSGEDAAYAAHSLGWRTRSPSDTTDEDYLLSEEDASYVSSYGSAADSYDEDYDFGGETDASGGDDDADLRLARLLQQQEVALAVAAGVLPPGFEDDVATEDDAGAGADPTADMSYEALIELEDTIGEARQRGMSSDAIALLERVPVSSFAPEGGTECVVCMSAFAGADCGEAVLVRLRCAHAFHEDCAAGWLRVRSTCPICRESVSRHP